MDVSRMRGPGDWPFPLTEDSSHAIRELVDGLASDAPGYLISFMEDEIHAAIRSQSEEDEDALRRYYLQGGYHADLL